MAEAKPSLHQTLIAAQARITTGAVVLAQLKARQAVRAEMQRQGIKVASKSAREISEQANEYLRQHRAELMPEARATVERWIADGVFGKRAQRALALAQDCSQSSTIPNTSRG